MDLILKLQPKKIITAVINEGKWLSHAKFIGLHTYKMTFKNSKSFEFKLYNLFVEKTKKN